MKVVLDTNVIISGVLHSGNPSRVLDMMVDAEYELCLSPFILGEVAGVLAHKFNRSAQFIAETISDLHRIATIVDPTPQADAVPGGHADNRILDCAAAVGADFLVTGDARHLLPLGEHAGTRIVNAAGFLEALRE